ncbi:MAG TPA: four helix bundle protein [bacterium]|nr:four helix bundle protein [bacterium]HNS33938.1 four helix bundle protein [bacterium]HOH67315.1 four helix bundle protein [bacterium]
MEDVDKNKNKHYDLEDRTLEYGKRIIKMARSFKYDIVNNNLINQVVRSGTSLGANYREANETETKKDFLFRMRICRKEAKETIYWLYLIIEANPELDLRMRPLIRETEELLKIFASIVEKSREK